MSSISWPRLLPSFTPLTRYFRFDPENEELSVSEKHKLDEHRVFFELSWLDQSQSIFASASLSRHYHAVEAGIQPLRDVSALLDYYTIETAVR